MSENNKYVNSFVRFLDYLSQKLKGKDRNAFEKDLEKDLFDKEAMEGLSQLSAEEFSSDMIELSSRIHHRIYKKSTFPYYRVAAGIAAMVVVSVLFFTLINRKIDDIPAQNSVAENKVETTVKDSIIPDVKEEKATPAEIIEKRREIYGEGKGKREKEKVIEESFRDEINTEAEESPMVNAETQTEDVSRLIEPSFTQTAPQKMNPAQEKESLAYAMTENQVLSSEKSKKSNRLSLPKEARREIEILPGMIPANSVHGKVVATDDSLPLPGASVVVKAYDKGSVTDLAGNFIIPLEKADSNITLTASFIGMETEEMQVSAGSSIDIFMNPDMADLEEVVVTGYGKSMDSSTDLSPDPMPLPDYKSFIKYIEKNMRFPESISGISRAVVVCTFLVDTNGRISQIEIIRSPHDAFSEEAKRLLLDGPKWKPAESQGNSIEKSVRLRIVFRK